MAQELHIYDFDGTLFNSPDRPDWWGHDTWVINPVSMSPPCVPQKPGAKWWIGKSVQDARKSIADKDVYAVLCTGRPLSSGLRYRIPELLKQKGLNFDEVLLNPTTNTPGFKAQETIRLLRQYPDIEVVHIWEDNDRNVKTVTQAAETAGVPCIPHKVRSKRPDAECDEDEVAQLADEGWIKWRRAAGLVPKQAKFISQRVFYHGTNAKGAKDLIAKGTFDPSKVGKRDEGFFGPGFYVAKNPKTASNYGSVVVEIHLKSSAKLMLGYESGKYKGTLPSATPSYQKDLDKWLWPKVRQHQMQNRGKTEEQARETYEWAYHPPQPGAFGHSGWDYRGWINMVNRWVKETKQADGIYWLPSEIVISNPKAIESITRYSKGVGKAPRSASPRNLINRWVQRKLATYKVVETDPEIENGTWVPLVTLADEYGGRAQIVDDDHCYVLMLQQEDGSYESVTHIFPEAFKAMRHLPAPNAIAYDGDRGIHFRIAARWLSARRPIPPRAKPGPETS